MFSGGIQMEHWLKMLLIMYFNILILTLIINCLGGSSINTYIVASNFLTTSYEKVYLIVEYNQVFDDYKVTH